MSTNVTWNGTTYAIPASGELNWSALSNFLIALGTNAAITEEMKQAIRTATATPITVSATTDFAVISKLSVAGAVAVTLPAGVNGQIFLIKDGTGDAATNNITITPNGADTIGGASTLVLNNNSQSVLIQYQASGTDWKVLLNPSVVPASGISGTLGANHGGTGVANSAASTMTVSGNFGTTFTVTGTTSVTLPTSGTLATLAGSESLTNKTLTSPVVVTDAQLSNQAVLKLYEQTGNGTNFIGLSAPNAVTADKTFKMPDGDGTTGQVLKTDGSLNLGWVSVSSTPATAGGVYTDGSTLASTNLAFSGNANKVFGVNNAANNAEVKTLAVGTSGSDFAVANAANSITFNLPDASASNRGVVTTGSQTFAGAKTLSSAPIVAGRTDGSTGASGNIGQNFLTNAGGNVNPAASGSYVDVVTQSVGAGSYLVWGTTVLGFSSMTGITGLACGISISGSANTFDSTAEANIWAIRATITASGSVIAPPPRYINVSGTTTVRLLARVDYAAAGDGQWQQSVTYLRIIRLF